MFGYLLVNLTVGLGLGSWVFHRKRRLWRRGRSMRLTVAIPTYNRNATLKATLEHLLPQWNERCKLLILDNHSDVPVEETLRDLLAAYPTA